MRKIERPEHFFISSCGGHLFDTRKKNWSANPIREHYQYGFNAIKTLSQVKATLRHGPTAWPGGYPLYFITRDGAALCFKCARKEFRQIAWDFLHKCDTGWRVEACEVNWEDDQCFCDHCSQQIYSAYGKEEALAQKHAEGRD